MSIQKRIHAILVFAAIAGFALLSGCDDNKDKSAVDEVKSILKTGLWRVTYFFDDKDETSDFTGYKFRFNNDGSADAIKADTQTTGTWHTERSDNKNKLVINFPGNEPLSELNEDWEIIEWTSQLIKLRHVSGGNGGTDLLTLEKD